MTPLARSVALRLVLVVAGSVGGFVWLQEPVRALEMAAAREPGGETDEGSLDGHSFAMLFERKYFFDELYERLFVVTIFQRGWNRLLELNDRYIVDDFDEQLVDWKKLLNRNRIWLDRNIVNDGSQMLLDEHGNGLGGVRNTYVDVPTAKYWTSPAATTPLIPNPGLYIATGGLQAATQGGDHARLGEGRDQGRRGISPRRSPWLPRRPARRGSVPPPAPPCSPCRRR